MAERQIHDSREGMRREIMSELLRAGWPTMDDYSKGLPTYKDKTEAQEIHRQFLVDLSELCLDESCFSVRSALKVGACAKDNMPRAMFLLGFIEEGGSAVLLPKGRWPILKEEPDGE